jgi:hypothetical protein
VIGAVVFDVGECLVDETREYGTWADWLGVLASRVLGGLRCGHRPRAGAARAVTGGSMKRWLPDRSTMQGSRFRRGPPVSVA